MPERGAWRHPLRQPLNAAAPIHGGWLRAGLLPSSLPHTFRFPDLTFRAEVSILVLDAMIWRKEKLYPEH